MLRIHKLGHLLLTLTVATSLGESAGRAASRLTEDLTEMLKMADAVVQVTVKGQRVQAESLQSLPFTVVTLSIEKTYKGALEAGAEIQAEYIGGAVNGGIVISPGQPQMNVGARAVLLLTRGSGAKNWRVLGGDAGQIVLARDGEGKELARRGSGRFDFYVADESSITGYRPVKGTAIYADQLGALLQAVLDTGRSVLEKEQPAGTLSLPVATAAVNSPAPSRKSIAERVLLVVLATTLIWAAMHYLPHRR